MTPNVEGYRDGWREDLNDPLSEDAQYLKSFHEARDDRHRRDGRYVRPSTASKPKPKAHQKISFSRRPAPPGARQGYKASSSGASP